MDLMDHMNLMDYMNAVMQNSSFCPSGSNKYRFFENKKNPEKQLLLLLPDFFFFKRTEKLFFSVFSAVFSAGLLGSEQQKCLRRNGHGNFAV